MSFAEKNEENLDALVFALSEREKTTILVGIYDTDNTRDQAIAHISHQLKAQRTLTLDLFGKKIHSLLAFFRENLPQPKGKKLPVVHLNRLDPLLFTARNHKVVSSDLVAQINMEREMLFHETQALVVIWLSRDGYNRLRMDAPDFMDWVAASFVFEKADSEPVGQTLSFTLPRETTEDRSKAALLELKEKADKLQQRTVKFECRAQLSTKDAKEYFNLLLALIAVLKDLHDLEQVESAINRACNLAKTHQLAAEFEMGKLLLDWGDTETALGRLHMAMPLFEEALRYFTLLGEKPNMAVAYERLGNTFSALGDMNQALVYFETQTKLFKDLLESFPQHTGFINGLAISYEKLGNTHSTLGKLQLALTYFEKETNLFEELLKAFPQNVEFKNNLAISYSKLGEMQLTIGNMEKALMHFQEYNRLEKELHEEFPQNVGLKSQLAISFSKLGEAQRSLTNFQQALTYFEEYNIIEEKLYESFPLHVEYKNNLAISYERLGDTHIALGNHPKALSLFEKEAKLFEELHDAFPQNIGYKNGLAISYAKLGAAHTSLGDLQQALTSFEQFTQLMKELHEASPQNVEYKSNYAESLSVLFAVKKLLSQAQETAHIDLAVKIFEELYLSSQRSHYQQKIDICFQMKESTGEDLKRLISEISAF